MKPIVIDSARIRERAFSRWQEQGCPAGTAERDWLEAEREIMAQSSTQAPAQVAAPAPAQASSQPARAATAVVSQPSVPRLKPPRPTLERAPGTRAAKLSNKVAPKGPPLSRTERMLAATAAAHIKRSAVGSS